MRYYITIAEMDFQGNYKGNNYVINIEGKWAKEGAEPMYFDTEEEAVVYAGNHIRENDINLIRFDVSVCKEPEVEE